MSEHPLEVLMRDEIARDGPLTFARFMELALYHPEWGYYAGGGEGRDPVGWSGDYFTSGDVHPLWGQCLAAQLRQMWELLGHPEPFTVVEAGAGRGLLAREVWAHALAEAPEWARALRYTLVERLPADNPLRARRATHLAEALAALGAPMDGTCWAATLAEAASPGAVVGCVIANELVDALPVHIVESHAGALREVYVDAGPHGLVEVLGAPSSREVDGYLDHFRISWRHYPDGWRAEICLAAAGWMREVAGALRRGFALTIDYGDTARRLYTRDRRRGTLAVYALHRLGERPLAQLGMQDLTAHVNFSALVEVGRAAGLRLAGLTTQRALLERLGMRTRAEALGARLYPAAESERHTDRGQADYLRRAALRGAVATLLAPEGLGGFRVLIQQRGMPGGGKQLAGLVGEVAHPDHN